MIMLKGHRYRCQNPRCEAEVRVEKESTDGFSLPICCCGAQMVRKYDAPAFQKAKAKPELIAQLGQKQK